MSGRQLERYLHFAVHGERALRAPRRQPRPGPARNWKYRAWIRTLPCAACESVTDIQAAHTGDDGGMSQKASDYSCVPLCPRCHAIYDNGKDSGQFEQAAGIGMAAIVRRLNALWFRYAAEVK